MRETKEKQIGERGYTYHVTQFGAKQGGRVLVRLLKMIGAAAGGALKGDDENAFSLEAIGRLLSNLAESVTEQDFDYLCDTFAAASQVSGGNFKGPVALTTEGLFDLHFAGAYKELGLWLVFAVEVNFGSFLPEGGIASLRQAASVPQGSADAGKPEQSPSRSRPISATTGPSGA